MTREPRNSVPGAVTDVGRRAMPWRTLYQAAGWAAAISAALVPIQIAVFIHRRFRLGPGVGEAAAGDRRLIAGRDGADWSA